MALILNIDTAGTTASICLSDETRVIAEEVNREQKDHAAWMHLAIDNMLKSSGNSIAAISAVAVSIGPGSYTGLRVGLSASKGLCYALNIPLITVGTLKLIALGARRRHEADLYCPLIDARRMEVYMAVYDKGLVEVKAPAALVIDEDSFGDLISSGRVVFCGDGSKKLQNLIPASKAIFDPEPVTAAFMPWLSYPLFQVNSFADLAYTEPLYIKEFYSPYRKDPR